MAKQLERARFGRSSEKLDADQEAFAFEEVETGLGAVEAELETAGPTNERRRSARPRKAFPAHLERVEVVIEPESFTCGCGNCRPVKIGEDVCERLDVTPAKFRVIVTRRPKYGCAQCKEGVSQAPAADHQRHFHRREALPLSAGLRRQDRHGAGADRLAPPGKQLLRAQSVRTGHRRHIRARR